MSTFSCKVFPTSHSNYCIQQIFNGHKIFYVFLLSIRNFYQVRVQSTVCIIKYRRLVQGDNSSVLLNYTKPLMSYVLPVTVHCRAEYQSIYYACLLCLIYSCNLILCSNKNKQVDYHYTVVERRVHIYCRSTKY